MSDNAIQTPISAAVTDTQQIRDRLGLTETVSETDSAVIEERNGDIDTETAKEDTDSQAEIKEIKTQPEEGEKKKAEPFQPDQIPENTGEPTWLRRMRATVDNVNKENRTLKQQIDELMAIKSEPEKAVEKMAAEPPKLSASDLFQLLYQVNNGEVDESYRKDIEDAITKLPPDDIVDIEERASRGDFGDKSDDINELAEKRYRFAVRNQKRAADAETKAETHRKEIAKNILGVLDKSPDLKDRSSKSFKDFIATSKFLFERYPGLASSPDYPQLVYSIYDANIKADRFEALEKENQNLRKKLNMSLNPGSSDASESVAASPETRDNSKWLRQQIQKIKR